MKFWIALLAVLFAGATLIAGAASDTAAEAQRVSAAAE